MRVPTSAWHQAGSLSSHDGEDGDGDGGGGVASASAGGGDGEDSETIVTAGFSSIVMPSAVEAVAAVPRVESSEACIAAAVVEAGTAMVAVMSTLPAVTAMVTSDLSTPAAVATPRRKLEVSE